MINKVYNGIDWVEPDSNIKTINVGSSGSIRIFNLDTGCYRIVGTGSVKIYYYGETNTSNYVSCTLGNVGGSMLLFVNTETFNTPAIKKNWFCFYYGASSGENTTLLTGTTDSSIGYYTKKKVSNLLETGAVMYRHSVVVTWGDSSLRITLDLSDNTPIATAGTLINKVFGAHFATARLGTDNGIYTDNGSWAGIHAIYKYGTGSSARSHIGTLDYVGYFGGTYSASNDTQYCAMVMHYQYSGTSISEDMPYVPSNATVTDVVKTL